MRCMEQSFSSLNKRDMLGLTFFRSKGAIDAVIAANEAKANAQAFKAKNEAEKMRLDLTDEAVAFPGLK